MQVSLDMKKLSDALPEETRVECPVKHHFGPEVYVREVLMPAGSIVLGHKHLTKHLNTMVTGRILLLIDGKITEMVAPCTFVSEAGVQKAARIMEDCIWQTIHPNPENLTDIEQLETLLIEKNHNLIPLEEVETLSCPSLM